MHLDVCIKHYHMLPDSNNKYKNHCGTIWKMVHRWAEYTVQYIACNNNGMVLSLTHTHTHSAVCIRASPVSGALKPVEDVAAAGVINLIKGVGVRLLHRHRVTARGREERESGQVKCVCVGVCVCVCVHVGVCVCVV